jgi:hypothetical protein
MNKHELFSIWAPPESVWSRWAKGVVFAHYRGESPPHHAEPAIDTSWVPLDRATAIIVDLPGALSIEFGMSLARIGFRPVPLFNAAPASKLLSVPPIPNANNPPLEPTTRVEVVDATSILHAVAAFADELKGFELPADAPPAFLLDATRRYGEGAVTPGRFDNRSVCFAADFPSAAFLASHGIARVLLVQESDEQPQSDLAHAVRRWQDEGVTILSRPLKETGQPKAIVVPKPAQFRSLWQRFTVALGLKRNPLGGFGREIPLYGYGAG